MSRTGVSIRIDESTPARIVISALEVIQPGLYGEYLAARAKLDGKEMENIRPKLAIFAVPGEVLPLPGVEC